MPKKNGLPKAQHLEYLESVTTDNGEFAVGESVWIAGWRKSPRSNNLVAQIVHNTRSGEVYANVFCENRGKGQWHSFSPDRLLKRKQRKV